MSSVSSSPARRPRVRALPAVARRRKVVALPSATHTVACPAAGRAPTTPSTISRRSSPSGLLTAPGSPIGVTSAPIRESRNVRTASRSRSRPTKYQRPLSVTTPHGSTVRRTYGSVLDGRCGNCTTCPESMADNNIPSTSSEPRSPGSAAVEVIAISASTASMSMPAARNFSTAPWVAVMSSGDSHSCVATATAAASSAVSFTAGSA